MINFLGIVDKINELNEKINNSIGDKFGNVYFGVAILAVLIIVVIFGINELNKH